MMRACRRMRRACPKSKAKAMNEESIPKGAGRLAKHGEVAISALVIWGVHAGRSR